MATFTPPYVLERPETGNRLIDCWAKVPRGVSVLKTDGVYASVEFPTQDQINAASEVYLGGHEYTISSSVATALTAAGYGSYIS